MPLEIVVIPNGPYKVSGDLSGLAMADSTGQLVDLTGKDKVFLCRCGASTRKPYCDGTHSKIGFQAAEAAVKAGG